MQAIGKFFQGWTLVIVTALAMGAMFAGILIAYDFSAKGFSQLIKITARPSIVLFGLAFTASALYRLAPNAWTKWQMKNRRFLGLSFAVSHLLHATALILWSQMYPELASKLPIGVLIGGGIGYIFVIAMAVTSFPKTTAMIGPKAWNVLHTTGAYYLWFAFFLGLAGRSYVESFYYPFLAFILATLAIRLYAKFAGKSAPAAAAA